MLRNKYLEGWNSKYNPLWGCFLKMKHMNGEKTGGKGEGRPPHLFLSLLESIPFFSDFGYSDSIFVYLNSIDIKIPKGVIRVNCRNFFISRLAVLTLIFWKAYRVFRKFSSIREGLNSILGRF